MLPYSQRFGIINYLTRPDVLWDNHIVKIVCVAALISAGAILRSDIKLPKNRRTKRNDEEWVLEPETEPRLTPSELDRKADSLKNSPGYNKARVEMDYFDLIYN